MTATDDRQITPDLTASQHTALKAIPKGHVFMKINEPGTWRYDDGHTRHVVTSTIRALIAKNLVRPDGKAEEARSLPAITPAGYAALSRAQHHKPKKRGR